MYWQPPTAAELAGTGYRLSDYPEPEVLVWDENWLVLELFRTYASQWRVGANGPTGLDFNVFHHAMDRMGIKGVAFDEWIAKLRIIESAALKELHGPR